MEQCIAGDSITELNNRLEQIVTHYKTAQELGLAALAHSHLGSLYKKLGKWEEAAAEYRALIAISPDSVYLSYLAEAFSHLGRYEEAAEYCRAAMKVWPFNDSAWELLEEMLRKLDREAEANRVVELRNKRPSFPASWPMEIEMPF